MLPIETRIRESVIPDLSVKMLNLCLEDEEISVLFPPTSRATRTMEYRADVTLKELISEKIKDSSNALPLSLRKKKLYQKTTEEIQNQVAASVIENLRSLQVVPIMMRKHTLYEQCRAG